MDWEQLTSTENIVGQWKEYFKDLLNPAETAPLEAEDFGLINQTEVTEEVEELLNDKAPEVDVRSLDTVRLSTSASYMLVCEKKCLNLNWSLA